MIGEEKHIINKVFVEVETTSKAKAFEIKDRLDMFLKERVFPILEKQFENLGKQVKYDIIRIDKVTFDIQVDQNFSYQQVQDAIIKNVRLQIQEHLQSEGITMPADNVHSEVFLSEEKSDIASFFHFLEQGTLPWWGDKKTLHFLEQKERILEVIHSEIFKRSIVESLKKPMTRQRLVKQFSDELMLQIMINVYNNAEGITGTVAKKMLTLELTHVVSKIPSKNRTRIWEELILFFQTKNVWRFYIALQKVKEIPQLKISKEQQQWFNTILEFLQSDQSIAPLLNKKSSETKPTTKKLEGDHFLEKTQEGFDNQKDAEDQKENNNFEGSQDSVMLEGSKEQQQEIHYQEQSEYYIENAGLLLLHPFLKHFFEHCDLLDEHKNLKNPSLAVHALHYIATKKEEQLECAMVFEKFLCNIPIQEPIDRNIQLSETIKEQAQELLKATLENWEGLKTSSIDLLRNEFIQRPGKLLLTGDHPKISMERKTQDILLDRIPWNISIIKLPWKPKLIFVDW